MKSTTLFAFGAMALVSVMSYIGMRKKQLEILLENLEFGISRISNFSLSFKRVAIDLHLHALNPTSESFHINTGLIKAKVLRVYYKKTGKLLAFTALDTNTITIPSSNFYFFKPIHVKIPLLTGGEILLNQLVKKEKLQQEFVDQLHFELEVTSLGKTQIIKF